MEKGIVELVLAKVLLRPAETGFVTCTGGILVRAQSTEKKREGGCFDLKWEFF